MIPLLSHSSSDRTARRWLSGLMLCLAALSLNSCMSGKFPLDDQTIQKHGLKPDEGYIVATVHGVGIDEKGPHENQCTAIPLVDIYANDEGNRTTVRLTGLVMQSPNRDPLQFGGGKPSTVIAVPVKAGSYSIKGWQLMYRDAFGTTTVSNRLPMNVPFQVKPGDASYVGRIEAMTLNGKNILGMPTFAGAGLILLKDEYAKDEKRLRASYPASLGKTPIRNTKAADDYMKEMKRISNTPREKSWLGF